MDSVFQDGVFDTFGDNAEISITGDFGGDFEELPGDYRIGSDARSG